MPRAAKQGDLFGIELECEGRAVDFNANFPDILNSWAPRADGSLRNNHGSSCEWVFNGPVNFDQSIIRVNELFDYFDKRKAKLVTSNRTSTHVHFNMGDKNAYQVVNLFILFTILEDIFGRYCGEDRNGNLFCLSSRHAQDQVRWIEDICLKHFDFTHLREDMRYCALNIASVNKFGTVEFRGMRGLDSRQDMLDWLSIINDFANYACYKMHNPVDIIEGISVKTPAGFLREIFSEVNYRKLTEGLDDLTIGNSVYEGLRLVQMLCYRVGTEFDKVRLKGKDFWASFGGGPDPVPDVDPEVLANQGAPRAKARRELGGMLGIALDRFNRPNGGVWENPAPPPQPQIDDDMPPPINRGVEAALERLGAMRARDAELLAELGIKPKKIRNEEEEDDEF